MSKLLLGRLWWCVNKYVFVIGCYLNVVMRVGVNVRYKLLLKCCVGNGINLVDIFIIVSECYFI